MALDPVPPVGEPQGVVPGELQRLREFRVVGGNGAALHMRAVPTVRGVPAHTVVELAVDDVTIHATFGPELAEAVPGLACEAACLAAAEAALLDVAGSPAPVEWMRNELTASGIEGEAQMEELRGMFLQWRTQAAAHVYRAVAASVAPGLPQRAGTRLRGRHVALCGENGSADVAADLCPEREVVRYGDTLDYGLWQSCLVLEPPSGLGDEIWVHAQVRHRLGGCGRGVMIDRPTPPGPGQDPAHLVVAWHAEDLDAIAAELGASAWVTLWGGVDPTMPPMLTRVIIYGTPRTTAQGIWLSLVRERAVAPCLWLPRPPAPRIAPRPPTCDGWD